AEAAKEALKNLHKEVDKHKGADGVVAKEVLEGFKKDFDEAVSDDLNIPKALGIVWNMAKYEIKSDDIYKLILDTDNVLGLDLDKEFEEIEVKNDDDELAAKVEEMLAKRAEARKNKDFATADAIRNELTAMGIEIKDTPQGATWTKK
ncbi:MAG: cysteine--tRNA ligase, partial [Oscillospiraceae bacterium]|nr:cysteine--tRNA ligase [Oscillospiraceae bacterium]